MMIAVKFLLTRFTYFALIAVLVAAGFGVPIPEDVPLIFTGYLCSPQESPLLRVAAPGDKTTPATAAAHVPDPWLMILAGMVGVVGGDSVLWYVGSRGIDSDTFIARHVRKVLHSKRRAKVEKYFKKHGNLTVFIGRFAPGVRAMVFAMAGISGMSYARFVVLDGLAGLISVPTFIFIGYHFAPQITHVFHVLDQAKKVIALSLIPLGVAAVIFYIVRKRRARVSDNTS